MVQLRKLKAVVVASTAMGGSSRTTQVGACLMVRFTYKVVSLAVGLFTHTIIFMPFCAGNKGGELTLGVVVTEKN